jgi:riboflavin transporter FmnP
MSSPSRTRQLSLIALLTAISIVLNRIISVPAPFAGFLYYEIWEIPVVLALLLIGIYGGVMVACLNALVLEVVFPGSLPTGPLYNLIAELAMFLGVIAVLRVAGRFKLKTVPIVAGATVVGAVSRTAIMTIVNGVVLPMPYPVGFSMPWAAVPGTLWLIGIFNLTIALYTVPLAFSVRNALALRYRLPMKVWT